MNALSVIAGADPWSIDVGDCIAWMDAMPEQADITRRRMAEGATLFQ